jgi:AhpD family alkylhydroperoxidase
METLAIDTSSSPAFRAALGVEKYLSQCSLEKRLQELIKLRVSQINGCDYSIDMHWNDARAAGETEQRLCSVSVWRESPYYTDREKLALLFAEEFTRFADGAAPEDVLDLVSDHFNEEEINDLTWRSRRSACGIE